MTTLKIERIIFNSDNLIKSVRDIPLDNISSMLPVCFDKDGNPRAGIVINYFNGLNNTFYDNKEGVLKLLYV